MILACPITHTIPITVVNTIIDYIFSKDFKLVSNFQIGEFTMSSDHAPLVFKIDTSM